MVGINSTPSTTSTNPNTSFNSFDSGFFLTASNVPSSPEAMKDEYCRQLSNDIDSLQMSLSAAKIDLATAALTNNPVQELIALATMKGVAQNLIDKIDEFMDNCGDRQGFSGSVPAMRRVRDSAQNTLNQINTAIGIAQAGGALAAGVIGGILSGVGEVLKGLDLFNGGSLFHSF